MNRVVWTAAALTDLAAIRLYIATFNPAAADRLGSQIIAAASSLIEFPYRGRLVRANIREIIPAYPYSLRYEVVGQTVTVLRVRHGRRRPLA